MGKEILFNENAKAALKLGVNKVADAIGSTMGAAGRTVIIGNHFSLPPVVTKDGATVGESVILDNHIENMGAQMIRGAASKTAKMAGDGTTQTAVLAQSIINNGLKEVAAGANPMEIKRGIEKASIKVLENLKRLSVDIGDDNDKIRAVATTSANNDEVIGGLIADAYSKIGKNGLLLIDKSDTINSSIEIMEGYEMQRGYISPDFATDVKKKAVHEKALVLVADYHIHTMKEVFPLLQLLDQGQLLSHPLIIVAQDYDGEFYSSMLQNHRNGTLRCCLIKAPSAYRKEHLEDIATMTGATVIRDEDGLKLQSITLKHLGSAEKIIISEQTTTVIGGGGKKEKIEDLKIGIKVQIDEMKDEQLKIVWERRLAKISGCIGVIKVGGATDVELGEKMDRVDDACRAVRSAIEEGIVVGGGVALLRCMRFLDEIETYRDEKIGINLIKTACKAPLIKMLDNSGVELIKKSWLDNFMTKVGWKPSILNDVINSESDFGYNIKTRQYCFLKQQGIIDPTKVIRCAMQNAVSVAGAIITSDCLVVEIPQKQ